MVLPSGITSTGWPAVRDKCAELGIEFDPWQDGMGRAILAKRADGVYAATVGGVVISIPRQVGKTFEVGAIVFALCLLFPGLTVIWTAHRLRTADETFAKMQALSRRRQVRPFMLAPVLGSGEEEIRFRNGSRILFGARSRGFGRGFDEVDVLIFDEAQILKESDLDDMVPAANQSRQETSALLVFMGTPPKPTDPGEVFTWKRGEALDRESDDTVYIEFSADRGARPDDRAQWAKANPSYPARTSSAAMLRMRKNLGADSFMREALGIWDESDAPAFPPGSWAACTWSQRPEGLRPSALAVAVAMNLEHAAIGAAAQDADGLLWLRPLEHGTGTAWVVQSAKEHQETFDVDVVVDERGPAASLLPELEKAGVRVTLANTRDVCDAYDCIYQAVRDGVARHSGNPALNASVAGAVARSVGDRFTWGRKLSTSDISLLEAETLAVWAAALPEPTPEPFFAARR